jgi:hypothetical protein
MNGQKDRLPEYNVVCRTISDNSGKVVATYNTFEAAEATRKSLNANTDPWLLQFYSVEEVLDKP